MSVLDTVRRIAATDASVLIMGENGTGKELIAETIHANSRRQGAPFVKVNLGGISRSLFESEMFGHKKGAFTGATADRKGRFEVADKGTIFLDEIGELDLNSQVKLLRVLQEHTFEVLGDSMPRKVDIRVVCATNADLSAMVAERTFREDLFYRINLITVTLPPLRERKSDIPELVNHFARQFGKANPYGYPRHHTGSDGISVAASLPGKYTRTEKSGRAYDADKCRFHTRCPGVQGCGGSQPRHQYNQCHCFGESGGYRARGD